MLPGREKRGALGSEVSQISMLSTQSSVPVYPQLDPLSCSWHTVKIFRMDGGSALGQPREGHEPQKTGLLLKGAKSLRKEIGHMNMVQFNGIARYGWFQDIIVLHSPPNMSGTLCTIKSAQR